MRASFAEHTRITLDGNAACAGWFDIGAACVVGRYLDVGFRSQVRLGRQQQRGKAGDLRETDGKLATASGPCRRTCGGDWSVIRGRGGCGVDETDTIEGRCLLLQTTAR